MNHTLDQSETWKDIEGYEGIYVISSTGIVKRFTTTIKAPRNGTRVIKARTMKTFLIKGYRYIYLGKNGIQKTYLLHRLVAKSFIENPENKKEVNHIDFNKDNNSVPNLEWVDSSENNMHTTINMRHKNRKYVLLDFYTGVFYPSLKQFSDLHNLDYEEVRSHLYNIRKWKNLISPKRYALI